MTNALKDRELTNADRASRCDAVLVGYTEYNSLVNLVNLLADARHWCDKHGVSYTNLDHAAYRYYAAKLAHERGGAK